MGEISSTFILWIKEYLYGEEKEYNQQNQTHCLWLICSTNIFPNLWIYQFTVEGKGTDFYSCFTGIFYSISSGNVQVAIQAIIVALIPMLGFLIFSFDKKRNIKNIYGVLSSVLAVFLIIGLTEMHLGWGSVLSIILYFPIVFLSSIGIFSNIVDAKNKAAYSNR